MECQTSLESQQQNKQPKKEKQTEVIIYGGSNLIKIEQAAKNIFKKKVVKYTNLSKSGATLKNQEIWTNVPPAKANTVLIVGIQPNGYFVKQFEDFAELYIEFFRQLLITGWRHDQLYCCGIFPRGKKLNWKTQRKAEETLMEFLIGEDIDHFSFFGMADDFFLQPHLLFGKADRRRKKYIHLNKASRKKLAIAIRQKILRFLKKQ